MTTQIVDLIVADRGVYRKSLASFIRKTTSVPKQVLPYMPAITKLQNPLIAVTGAPTDRRRARTKTYDNLFSFSIQNIVLYTATREPDWLPEHAEDMLDKLEREVSIALLLADMQSDANHWNSVSREGASTFAYLQSEGVKWITETIPVVMRVDDEQKTE